jgi:tRNA threonylcarbamoyladenosine biosynthesis protein TsaE
VDGPVTSPTFTIGRRYAGRVAVAHVDLYRLDGLEAEDPALLADYLTPDAIAFVEWPERAQGALPSATLTVRIEHLGGDARRIVLEHGVDG